VNARESLIYAIYPEMAGPGADEMLDEYRAEALAEVADLFDGRGRALLDGGIMTASDAAALIREHAAGQAWKDAREGESTQPSTDFFQPDHTYAHAHYRFQCLHLVTHPVTSEVQAWGWFGKDGADGRRHMSFGRGQWEARTWDDVTEDGAR
jgi:hypothetical protein